MDTMEGNVQENTKVALMEAMGKGFPKQFMTAQHHSSTVTSGTVQLGKDPATTWQITKCNISHSRQAREEMKSNILWKMQL